MKIRPLGNRVLVVADAKAEKSRGGIDLPQNATGNPQEGTVLAVGDECDAVSVGDRVIFAGYAGSEIKVEGEAYLVLDTRDILGRKEE